MTGHAVSDRKRRLVVLVAGLAWACGKVGPLQPPVPRGPYPPQDVVVRQLGDRVEVALTLPRARSEEVSQAVQRTEILRVAYPRGRTAPSERDAFRVRGEVVATIDAGPANPGERVVIADPSLSELADGGIGWTLRYGVRVRDRRGRPSPLVVGRDLIPVAVAAPPRELTGRASADGVRLAWQAPEGTSDATYNVYRGPAHGALSERPLNVQPLTSPDELDATVEPGTSYRYVVRAVAAQGPPYRESLSSPEIVVDASDVFPPAFPGGLVAVQEGTGVRLLWNPGAEADLDGYRVYRAWGDGEFARVGGEIVRQPSFLDAGVTPGTLARYRVTAVDRAVPPNESAPSQTVEVRVAADPQIPPASR